MYSCELQNDGKIILAGYSRNGLNYDFAVVRLNSDGSLDNNFDGDGYVLTDLASKNDLVRGMLIQPNGKIVVTGYYNSGTYNDIAILRYNEDGSLDNSFGTGGKSYTKVGNSNDFSFSVAMQPDGKLVVCGKTHNGLYDKIVVARFIAGWSVGLIDFSTENNAVYTCPNPMSENTKIKFSLFSDESITIQLFDMTGKLISTLLNEELMLKGNHSIDLPIYNSLESGNYILKISNGAGLVNLKVAK
jgi:uncharacterized delta-60 repeat protein